MPVGSKWLLFVPSDLAYGERGAGGVIGPNSTIVFEMELVSIQPKETKPETKPEMKPETKPEQKPAEEPKQPPKQTP